MPGKQIEGEDLEKLIAEAKGEAPAAVAVLDDSDDDDEAVATAVDDEHGVPDWAASAIPPGFKFPPGWIIWFIRCKAALTNKPGGPDRILVLWNLSESDEKRAAKRARGEGLRLIDEMGKQMIRCADGKKISLAPDGAVAEEGSISLSTFWSEIGGKYRSQIKSIYLKTHVMSTEENADFFLRCVAPRTVG